jgi:hypothetical protein
MSEIPGGGQPVPDDKDGLNDSPADAFSPVVDPDLVPGTEETTPEEKKSP